MVKWIYDDQRPTDSGEYLCAFLDHETGVCYVATAFFNTHSWDCIDVPYAWAHMPTAPQHPTWKKK